MPVPMADDPLLLRQTVLDTTDARGLAEFYRELLGLAYRPGARTAPARRGRPGRAGMAGPAHPGREPARLPAGRRADAVDVAEAWRAAAAAPRPQVTTREALEREHARALALGARVLRDDSQDEVEPLYVYADPAGHPFCIFVAAAPVHADS